MKPGDLIITQACLKAAAIVSPQVQSCCFLPYPGHPKGCPNYNNRSTCPPHAKLWNDGEQVAVIAVKFDLAAWAAEMKRRHPDWTDKQCRCCLYWQGAVRKALQDWAASAKGKSWGALEMIPEAHGVDVTKMMKRLGLPLQWPPRDFVWKVAMRRRVR